MSESRPPSTAHKSLASPPKRVRKTSTNTLRLTDDDPAISKSESSAKPVPMPRSSHGAPAVSRRLQSFGNETVIKSQASQEFENFAKETGLSSLSNSLSLKGIETEAAKSRKIVKRVEFQNGVHKISYSPESVTGTEKTWNADVSPSASYTSSHQPRRPMRTIDLNKGKSVTLAESTFAEVSGVINDEFAQKSTQAQKQHSKRTKKSLGSKGYREDNLVNTLTSENGNNVVFDHEPDGSLARKAITKQVAVSPRGAAKVTYPTGAVSPLSGLFSPVAAEGKQKSSPRKTIDVKDGQVKQAEAFDEVTLSSLATPRDEDNTVTDTPRSVYVPSKAIEISGGASKQNTTKPDVGTKPDLQSLVHGGQNSEAITSLVPSCPVRPTRSIDLTKRSRTGEVSDVRSPVEEGTGRSLELERTETWADETTQMTKSKDNQVTSWVEFQEGKRHVRHSDEVENFSLGEAMEFTPSSKPRASKPQSTTHKQVHHGSSGQVEVRLSDEMVAASTLSYTGDFEPSTGNVTGDGGSWAVRVATSPRQPPRRKNVSLSDGRQQIEASGQRLAESTLSSIQYSPSFDEVTIEDLDSYSQQFESVTPKSLESRSLTSIPYQLVGSESTISTHTPITSLHSSFRSSIHTSIPTSIRTSNVTSQPQEQERDKSRTSQLYTESFESTTSLLHQHSLTYSDTWESDISAASVRVPSQYRKALGLERLERSEDEDDYTMSFTQSTALDTTKRSSSSESLAERRLAAEATDDFVNSKLRLLKCQQPKPAAPRKWQGQEEKVTLGKDEKTQLKKFLKAKLGVLSKKGDSQPRSAEDKCTPSASVQLRGLSDVQSVEKCGVSPLMLARLRAENSLANMKRAVETEIHKPSACKHCRVKRSELAAEEFVRRKKAVVTEKLIQEKVETHCLLVQDPMWLYAEALRDLPRVTDDPDDIYLRLMRPLYDTYAGKCTDTLAPT